MIEWAGEATELEEFQMGNHTSCRICEALEHVNTVMEKCRLCRTKIKDIELLGEHEFVFDWLPFHWPNSECVKLIALTMEPSDPGARREPDPVMSASRVLIYALRRLLVQPSDGFLITSIAKCSLTVKKASETHGQRWDLCSPFLLQEIDALMKTVLLCPNFSIVTVGNHPDGFLRKAPSMTKFVPQRLGKLTHFGAFRGGRFKVVPAEEKAFARFVEKHEPDYRAFVKEHISWDQDELDRELGHDIQILFKWNQEMDPRRERGRAHT